MDRGYGGMTSFYEAHPNLKKYASVTSVLSVLSEPSKDGELIHHQDVASWKQSIVLDSYGKQIMYTQKKQVRTGWSVYSQPNRVFSTSDLDFMRRVAESAPKQGSVSSMIDKKSSNAVEPSETKSTTC